MKRVRYPAEFKAEAVRQVTERGHGVVDVASAWACRTKVCTFGCALPKTSPVLVVEKTHPSKRRYPGSRLNLKGPMRSVTF